MDRSLCVNEEILLETSIMAEDEVAHIVKETMEKTARVLLKAVPVEAGKAPG